MFKILQKNSAKTSIQYSIKQNVQQRQIMMQSKINIQKSKININASTSKNIIQNHNQINYFENTLRKFSQNSTSENQTEQQENEEEILNPEEQIQKPSKSLKLQKRNAQTIQQFEILEDEFENKQSQQNPKFEKKYKRDYNENNQIKQNEKYLINTIFEDQKRIQLNATVVGLQASEIVDRDLQTYQQDAIQEMKNEKNQFLQYLDRQEKLLKQDVNKRVFSIVNELQEIKEQEDQFIDEQIRAKKGQKQEQNQFKSKKETNYDLEMRRKEILVKQAALNPLINLKRLIEIIPDFENMKEDQKRQIYQSIKIGQSQELAKIELYKYENEPGNTQNLIKKSQVKAQLYQNLLKQIFPKEFKNEFLSLKEIQKKRDAAEKAFTKAQNEFKHQLTKMKEQKYELQRNKHILNDYDLVNDSIEYLLADKQNVDLLISYQEFQKKIQKIEEIKQCVDSIKNLDDTIITQQQREIEKSNQSKQISAEYDAEQQKNILLLTVNLNNEIFQKLKNLQVQSADRHSQATDKQGDKNDQILFDGQSLIENQEPVSFKKQQQELLSLLKKYRVDPQWLQNQQTKHLKEYMDEQSEHLMHRALQIENNLLTQERQSIMKLINKKLGSNEIKQHLLNSLKSQSFVEGVNEYYGQQDQLLNEVLIAQIENQIEKKDFNVTEFIMRKLKKIDEKKSQLREPAIIKTEKMVKEQNDWQSANQLDQVKHDEVLDYERYRLRQIRQLHQKNLKEQFGIKQGLFQNMNLSKQRAWYNIYNDYLQNQKDYVPPEFKNSNQLIDQKPELNFKNKLQLDMVSNEKEFYGLFENWEFKAFLLQGNFEQKEVKNIEKTLKYLQDIPLVEKLKPEFGDKAYEMVGIQEPNIGAAFSEALNIIQKNAHLQLSAREDELFIGNKKNVPVEQLKKINARMEIAEKENFINMFHDELLKENDIFYMYDKVEGKQDHDLVIKTFEAALKELNEEKKEFTQKYGVHVHNFNPVEIQFIPEIDEPYKEIISLTGQISDEQYIKDRKFVTDLIEKTYIEQFPKDPKMQKYIENMPNFKISEDIRELIKEHEYNEEIQEKYYNAIHNEKNQLDGPKQDILEILYKQLPQKNQIDLENQAQQMYFHRMGEDLDDELINRINSHLDENNMKNIKVIDSLQMPGDENGKELFDIRKFEQMKKEGMKSNLSDYQIQQHLLFRQRHKQSIVNQAFKERDYLLYEHEQQLEQIIKQNQFKKEKSLKIQQQQIQNIEQELIEDVNKGEQNQNSFELRLQALLKNKMQENKELKSDQNITEANDDIIIESQIQDQSKSNFQDFLNKLAGNYKQNTKINNLIQELQIIYGKNKNEYQKQKQLSMRQAQKQLLKEDKEKGTDPFSLKIKEIIQNKSEFDKQNIQSYKELEDYINIDQFGTLSKQSRHDLLDSYYKEALQESEEKRMREMANQYQEFDMMKIVEKVQLPQAVYTGESWKNNDKLSNIVGAFSSTQIVEAAKSQNLDPEKQKLALLYDPFNPVREQYLRTKYQMYVNSKIRQDLASKILQAQEALGQSQMAKYNYEMNAQKIIDRFSGQVLPQKAFDLIQAQQNKQREKETHKVKAKDIVQRINKFDPQSQDISNFNDELIFHLKSIREYPYNELQQIRKNNFHQQISYILKQLKLNNLKPDEQTHSILFQINLEVNELDKANQNLKNILILENKRFNNELSLIQEERLRKFFEISISRDNFEGLAHLVTFLERKGVDISEWNMNIFRSAVDFYLNHTFNINHIFTFTRFYVHHAKSCLASKQNIQDHLSNIEQQKPEVLALVHKEIFGQLENIVDMNLLFQLLVKKIGNQTLLDPISKIDPMQNIIDFFSIKEIQAVQKYSELSSTFINDDDISKYYANSLSNPESFQRIFDQVLKFNDNQYFISNIIKILRDHVALKDGKLPLSFQNVDKIQKLYLQLKSSLQNEIKISEKTAEFLFFLFKMNKMTSESLDLSQNYHNLVEGYQSIEQAQKKSNIRNYYMSETLFNFQIDQNKQSFNKLVEEAVFNNRNDNSEAYISSMMKAYMLDGNIDYALQFFMKSFNERKSNHSKQEDMLVKIFDSSFGNIQKSESSISLNNFKNKYFDLMQTRQQLKNEAGIVKQLEKILNNCDPEEIECMFMLQAVLREQKMILMKLCDISKRDYHIIENSFEKCSNDKDSINQFINSLASKYSLIVQHPELLQDFKNQLIQQSINVDLLNNSNFNQDISLNQSNEEQKFLDILSKIKYKFANEEVKKQINKKIDLLTIQEWFDILKEQNIFEKAEQELRFINKIQTELLKIKERKEILDLKIKNKNKEHLMNILKNQENNQVEILENVENVDEILQTLGISEEEISSYKKYEKEKEYIDQAIEYIKIDSEEGSQIISERINSSVIEAFKSSISEQTTETLDSILKQKVENDFHEDLFNRFEQKYGLRNVRNLIRKGFQSRDGLLKNREDIMMVNFYKKFLYEDAPDDNPDNYDEGILVKDKIYTENLKQFEDELRSVLDTRRNSHLPFAIEQFNKIQGKQMPIWLEQENEINSQQDVNIKQKKQDNLDSQKSNLIQETAQPAFRIDDLGTGNQISSYQIQENISGQNALQDQKLKDPALINETIQKYDYLLNESSSPIISNFVHLLEYRDGRDIIDYTEFYQEHKAGQSKQLLSKYLKQSEQLETLSDQVDKMISVANDMKNLIYQQNKKLVDEVESAQQFQVEFTEKREQKLQDLINKNVQQLYQQFVAEQNVQIENIPSYNSNNQESDNGQQDDNQLYKQQYSREQKISFMKQALSFELGGFKTYEIFNSFFAEDFIVFGMHNNIPEAVRLGEFLLSEQNYVLSQDLQNALRNYKLNEGKKYRDAISRTGPINIQSIYKNVYNEDAASEKYSKSSIMSADDPYWKEYIDRNYRAQDRYKIPSAFAWDHKDEGILGEIFNFKDLEKKKLMFDQL